MKQQVMTEPGKIIFKDVPVAQPEGMTADYLKAIELIQAGKIQLDPYNDGSLCFF